MVLIQPVTVLVKEIVVLPVETVVTTPVELLIVATPVFELPHVPPPEVELPNVNVLPIQTLVPPVMGALAFTVTGLVTKQPTPDAAV